MSKIVIAAALLGASCSCANHSETSPGTPSLQLQQYSVEVSATDPVITFQPQAQHLVMECTGSACHDKLFIFFPGTGGAPQDHQLILQSMGEKGISGIVLAYENAGTIQSLCADNDGCYRQSRLDRLFGSDTSIYVSSKADGIENRLLKLLKFLGWAVFYTDNSLNYEKIVFGGFSQGAGMAALMGKQKSVQRVCLFAGPWDHVAGPVSATWLSDSSATLPSKFYGFAHWHDSLPDGVTYLDINWQLLGMGGVSVSSYQNLIGQKFYSDDTDANCAANYHACAVSDSNTPVNSNGKPRYQGVWQYLCDDGGS